MVRQARLAVPAAVGTVLLVLGLSACDDSSGTTGPGTTPTPSPVNVPTPVPPNLPPPRTPGPHAPVLVLHLRPDPATGPAPLDVNFNLCPSFDPDGDRISYTYQFGDGKTKQSNYCRHGHVYATGSYTARICGTDGAKTTCRAVDVTAF